MTKPGLPLKVGEPAINPGPRQIISENIQAVAENLGAPGHVEVMLSVDNGQELAKKTWNRGLGSSVDSLFWGLLGSLCRIPVQPGSLRSIRPSMSDVLMALIIWRAALDPRRNRRLRPVIDLVMATSSIWETCWRAPQVCRDHPIPKLTVAGGFETLETR